MPVGQNSSRLTTENQLIVLFQALGQTLPSVVFDEANDNQFVSRSFATELNLCYQRNLFQLYKHCQSIVIEFVFESNQFVCLFVYQGNVE